MTTTIPPLTPTPQQPSMADTLVKGEIKSLLPAIANLKSGDNILLQIMMDDLGKYSLNIQTPQSTLLTQPQTIQPQQANSPSTTNHNPQTTDHNHTTLTIDKPLNLEPNKEIPITAKVISTNNGAVQIKLTTIDNIPADKFISKAVITNNEPQTANKINNPSIINNEPRATNNTSTLNLPLQILKPTNELAAKLDLPLKPLTVNISLSLGNASQQASNNQPQITGHGSQFTEIPLKGEVIALPDKPVIIRTELGDVVLDKSIKLPPQTEVALTIKDLILPKPDIKTDTILDILKPLIKFSSPLKGENTIAPSNTKSAVPGEGVSLYQQVLSKLPAPDNKMISNMLSFMKAAQNKDVSHWLGQETVQNISSKGAEGQEIIAKLNNFVTNSVREPNQAWRVIEVPFFSGELINSIRVSIKENFDEPGSSDKKKKSGTRFLIDTNFSKLGQFQFDGFAVEKERRFDLLIRTSQEMDDDLYSHILRLFKTTLNDLDYVGNLKINVKENFIKICDDNNKDSLQKGILA